MSSSIEKIKERLEIADVIGSYIKVEKAGANFKAKCPFHNEKTPSFFISASRGTYYCFGCGQKGDIFTFVQEFEGLDFMGSLKLLAERAGVELEQTNTKEKGESDRLREIAEMATIFFVGNLSKNKSALEYLEKRGLTKETISSWRLGYAPNEWRSLVSHLRSKSVSDSEMEKVGLVKKSDKGREDGIYDVFRGRIIFPIFDSSGRVIAFSGRIFDEVPEAPKYLNSPETPLFIKSETLYGFDRAKAPIRKRDYSILVEGQMDLLMCHQAGFDNAVASSGTAFTEGHLVKLQKLSNNIMFVFDADGAGRTAGMKAGEIALLMGLDVKLVPLPKGDDPAELILKDKTLFQERIKGAQHIIDYYIDIARENKEKVKIVKEVQNKILPLLVRLGNAISLRDFVSRISRKTEIKEEAIYEDLKNLKSKIQNTSYKSENDIDSVGVMLKQATQNRKNYIERRILGIIFWQEKEKEPVVDTTKLRTLLVMIAGEPYITAMLAEYKPLAEEIIFEAESYYGDKEALTREVTELVMNFEEDILREQFVKIMRELGDAERDKEKEKAEKLLAQCQEISQKLAELSKRRMEKA